LDNYKQRLLVALKRYNVKKYHLQKYSKFQLKVLAKVCGEKDADKLKREELERCILRFKNYSHLEYLDVESIETPETEDVLALFEGVQLQQALEIGKTIKGIEDVLSDISLQFFEDDFSFDENEQEEEITGLVYKEEKYHVLKVDGISNSPAISPETVFGFDLRIGDEVKATIVNTKMKGNRKRVKKVLLVNGDNSRKLLRCNFDDMPIIKPKQSICFQTEEKDEFGYLSDVIADFKLGQSIVFGIPENADKNILIKRINTAFSCIDGQTLKIDFDDCNLDDVEQLKNHFQQMFLNVERAKRRFERGNNTVLIINDGYLATLCSNATIKESEKTAYYCYGIYKSSLDYISEIINLARCGKNCHLSIVVISPTANNVNQKDAVYAFFADNCTSSIYLNDNLEVVIDRSHSKNMTRKRADILRAYKRAKKA